MQCSNGCHWDRVLVNKIFIEQPSHEPKVKLFYRIGITERELTQVGSELNLLESNLETALQIARSRFKLQHRGILAKAFGGILDKFARK